MHKCYRILVLIGVIIAWSSIATIAPQTSAAQPTEVPTQEDQENPPAPSMVEPASLQDKIEQHTGQCDTDRCRGTQPDLHTNTQISTTAEQRTHGSNTQVSVPRNLLLADINGDGTSDFVQYTSNKIFVSQTDFERTGILHHYVDRPIKRVLTGNFDGAGDDELCTITDQNRLACFGTSPQLDELWWWFTQGAIANDQEELIVGDFDGNGHDDILVYPTSGEPFRLYTVREDFFFEPLDGFQLGNLTSEPGLQVRAGDFNADGRTDVMLVNTHGQLIYHGSVHDGSHHTFWWAFTTNGGFIGNDDQVTIARIDNDTMDDVVVRNQQTGATRFFRMEWSDGVLPEITDVALGQLATMANSLVFWGPLRSIADESNTNQRDDALVYNLENNTVVRSDARWDGQRLTYWWAHTGNAPNNHRGWAPFTAQPWLTIKCQFADVDSEPEPDQFYHDLNESVIQYWRDQSYGSWDLTGSRVIDEWHPMPFTLEEWGNLPSRWDRAQACVNAYGGDITEYVNVISIVNDEGDAGNTGGRVVATPNLSNVTFFAHEMGHTFGWPHSFDDTDRKLADWSAPGEYYDHWDIMSAMNVFTFNHPQGRTSGPGLNAPYRTRHQFIPGHRTVQFALDDLAVEREVRVAALNRPEANGALLVRVGANDADYYTIEYRIPWKWDQGIPQATILVRRVVDDISYLITEDETELLEGSSNTYPLEGQRFTVEVSTFATEDSIAEIVLRMP